MSEHTPGPWDSDSTRDYIGGGVYVAFDGYSILIRVNDHRNAGSEICLEPDVLNRLNRFAKRMNVPLSESEG